ncbi:hypothetical protein T01_1173 [Trichinella spiralis]|uniref:Uncharacterized protein n=1 Tax=Trichinella spiralis TaxID=6334 RepID=A0A0V1BQ86_TRISP|nr:hypothetical protein T01_1173 [Trichinella spiralis]
MFNQNYSNVQKIVHDYIIFDSSNSIFHCSVGIVCCCDFLHSFLLNVTFHSFYRRIAKAITSGAFFTLNNIKKKSEFPAIRQSARRLHWNNTGRTIIPCSKCGSFSAFEICISSVGVDSRRCAIASLSTWVQRMAINIVSKLLLFLTPEDGVVSLPADCSLDSNVMGCSVLRLLQKDDEGMPGQSAITSHGLIQSEFDSSSNFAAEMGSRSESEILPDVIFTKCMQIPKALHFSIVRYKITPITLLFADKCTYST